MTLQFTLIYRTSNFAESKALDFETRNVFKKQNLNTSFVKNKLINNNQVEKNKIQKRYYSNITKKEEKIDQAQTWSEYLYPYFTSEYYYVGQVATTVAVVTTAAVVYWYVAPAVASYYYGNNSSNNTPSNNPPTAPSNNASNAQEISANTTPIKTNTEILNAEPMQLDTINSKIDTIYKNINNLDDKHKDLYNVCEKSITKIKELLKNKKLENYINDIREDKYFEEIVSFFENYDKKKIDNHELLTPEVIKDMAVLESLEKNTIDEQNIKSIHRTLTDIDQGNKPFDEIENGLTDGLDIVLTFLQTLI